MTGTLHLVGVGPGDPELITVKAVRLLDEVDVVAYPDPGSGAAMALDIARIHINPHAELLPMALPMRVEPEAGQAAYDAGADAIGLRLEAGRDVAYLCEGDPLFYGSAMYLLARFKDRARVAVIPGITSISAAAAAIPVPLVARNEMLTVLPATLSDTVLHRELLATPSVAIIKIGRHFDRIVRLLKLSGRFGEALLIEHASTARQRIVRLRDGAEAGERPYFSLILCVSGAEFSL